MNIDPRIKDIFQKQNGFPLDRHLVVLGLVGSHSHGTYMPPEDPDSIDDVDYMGFVVPPMEYHLGIHRWTHWTLQYEELDVVLYSMDKAMRLLLKNNPNIVGLLWLRENEYLYRHETFKDLMQKRDIFSSKVAAHSFSGYVRSQLRRMKSFDNEKLIEYEKLSNIIQASLPVEEVLGADSHKLSTISKQWNIPQSTMLRFKSLYKKYFKSYMGEKRKTMMRRYNYDVKCASHIIRLLRMGIEFLNTGKLHVYRDIDADELKAIKRGKWTLEEVTAEFDRLFLELENAKEKSMLSEMPDYETANQLLINIQRAFLNF